MHGGPAFKCRPCLPTVQSPQHASCPGSQQILPSCALDFAQAILLPPCPITPSPTPLNPILDPCKSSQFDFPYYPVPLPWLGFLIWKTEGEPRNSVVFLIISTRGWLDIFEVRWRPTKGVNPKTRKMDILIHVSPNIKDWDGIKEKIMPMKRLRTTTEILGPPGLALLIC